MSAEDDCVVDVKEEYLDESNNPVDINNLPPPQHNEVAAPIAETASASASDVIDAPPSSPSTNRLEFSDVDYVRDVDNNVSEVVAPKTIEELEIKRKQREEQERLNNDNDDDSDRIKISWDEELPSQSDIEVIGEPTIDLLPDLLMDVEVLD